MTRPATTRVERIDVLGTRLEIGGPDALTEPVRVAFRRFAASADESRAAHRIVASAERASIEVDGVEWPIVEEIDPSFQVYQRVVRCALREAGDVAVLHAGAVVDREGGGILLAAPSGHGKTTLTLALLDRGFRLLGDDYAPLELETRRIRPFPRAVGVRPGARGRLPRAIAEAAAAPDAVRFLGKSLVDPGRALGDAALADEPAPLHCVILLEAGTAAGEPAYRVELGTLDEDGGAIEEQLGAIAGLTVASRERRGRLSLFRVEIDPAGRATPALSRILDDDAILFSQKYAGRAPGFDREPRAERLGRRLAAQRLASEMLNRHPDGALVRRYGGDTTALFVDLAGALSGADCWRVAPGRFEDTLELVAKLAAGK